MAMDSSTIRSFCDWSVSNFVGFKFAAPHSAKNHVLYCVRNSHAEFSLCRLPTCDIATVIALDTVRYGERSRRRPWHFRQSCLRSWLGFNFCGMPAANTCDGPCYRRRSSPCCIWSLPFLRQRKMSDLLLKAFQLKRSNIATQGRTWTPKPDLSYPNLSPLPLHYHTDPPKFQKKLSTYTSKLSFLTVTSVTDDHNS